MYGEKVGIVIEEKTGSFFFIKIQNLIKMSESDKNAVICLEGENYHDCTDEFDIEIQRMESSMHSDIEMNSIEQEIRSDNHSVSNSDKDKNEGKENSGLPDEEEKYGLSDTDVSESYEFDKFCEGNDRMER